SPRTEQRGLDLADRRPRSRTTMTRSLLTAACLLLGGTAFAQYCYDGSGALIGRIDGNYIYDGSGSLIGREDGNYLYDGGGSLIGRVDEDYVYSGSGSLIGRIDGNYLYDGSGSLIGRTDGVDRRMATRFYYFYFR